jgi:hypothetical protein
MTIEIFIGSVARVRSCVIHTAHVHVPIITRVDEIAMFDMMFKQCVQPPFQA